MIGSTFAHYTILEEVGRGGMGVVYRARDARLDREVAIKVLRPEFVADPDRRERFLREARSAAALDHPHVAAIYDVGEADGSTYIAMPLLHGQPLRALLARGRLPVRQALTLTLEIADGLSAAHDRNIVHRDLSPANIHVGDDGHARIIDFGLAKLLEPPAADAETQRQTAPGATLGTVGYMSPEQARGEPSDHRADVFMLGILLHEMLSGEAPFRRASALDTMHAVVHEPPSKLVPAADADTSGTLSRAVEKCLAKDPGDRYQTMKDLAVDLRTAARRLDLGTATGERTSRRVAWMSAAALIVAALLGTWAYTRLRPAGTAVTRGPQRIAVLVFQNLGAAEDNYFAAGVSEEIMSRLAGVPQFAVIARNSVLRYSGSSTSAQEIGRELRVDYILQGTVRWQPSANGQGQIRVTPQLVRVADDTQVWSETYERQFDQIFAVQSDIAARVTAQMGAVLDSRPRPARPTENLDAYREYLKGTYLYFHIYSRTARSDSLQYFERAAALDPRFAAAHGAVALASAWQYFYEAPTPAWEAKAEAAIERALALDPSLPEAYLARANLLWTQPRGFPHAAAMREYRRAIELNPSSAEARVALARLYQHIGLLDEAKAELTQALDLDPSNEEAPSRLAVTLFWQHDYRGAVETFDRYRLNDRWTRIRILSYQGRDEDAAAQARLVVKEPWTEMDLSARGTGTELIVLLLARLGQRDRAMSFLPKLEETASNPRGLSHLHHVQYDAALTHAILGHKQEAVTWLRKAAAEGFPCFPFIEKDPNLASLAGDPEFEAFMRELKGQWEGLRALARQ